MSFRKFTNYNKLFSILYEAAESNKEYILVNIFLTLEGARPSCLIVLKKESFEKIKEIFDDYGIDMFNYRLNSYLVINPKTPVSLISSSLNYIKLGKMNENYHSATGKLLGYMKPMDILKARGGKKASITTHIDDNILAGLVPQRIGDASEEETLAYYKPVLRLLNNAFENPSEYSYFPYKFTGPPKVVIEAATGGRRKCRRTVKIKS
jgi:hypothetical protein